MQASSLDAIFKAYDVRGVYPDELDESVARRVGNAFVGFTGAARVVVGRDARPSSEPLSEAFSEGTTLAGADVVNLGLASTDLVYFASGHLDAPGAMFTASHNPAPPPPELAPSCAEGGVLGVLPGVIGSLQASEALKLALEIGEPLVGRLLLFDALAAEFSEVKLRRDPDCPVCGEHPTITDYVDYVEFCAGTREPA